MGTMVAGAPGEPCRLCNPAGGPDEPPAPPRGFKTTRSEVRPAALIAAVADVSVGPEARFKMPTCLKSSHGRRS
jgi:hypothetical protein